jgi:hypothetical protein
MIDDTGQNYLKSTKTKSFFEMFEITSKKGFKCHMRNTKKLKVHHSTLVIIRLLSSYILSFDATLLTIILADTPELTHYLPR